MRWSKVFASMTQGGQVQFLLGFSMLKQYSHPLLMLAMSSVIVEQVFCNMEAAIHDVCGADTSLATKPSDPLV